MGWEEATRQARFSIFPGRRKSRRVFPTWKAFSAPAVECNGNCSCLPGKFYVPKGNTFFVFLTYLVYDLLHSLALLCYVQRRAVQLCMYICMSYRIICML